MTITNGHGVTRDVQEIEPRAPLPCNGALEGQRLVENLPWVRSVARNLVRDQWGAEDVTQETLLAALAAPPRGASDERALRAWLARVAFNLSRLGVREGQRRRAREQRVARREALPSVCEEVEASATAEGLSRAIDELPADYRRVVLMRYFEGLSMGEIARRTSASELAVRKRLWRARCKLRAALDYDPESGQLFAALLPWSWLRARTSTQKLAGLAASAALVAGATLWFGGGWRGQELAGNAASPALAAGADAAPRVEAALPAAPESEPVAGTPRHRQPQPWTPEDERVTPSDPGTVDAVATLVRGEVLDLEGQLRPGLSIVEPSDPLQVLATTDALGSFRFETEELPAELAALGAGWTTIVPGQVSTGRDVPLIVASALEVWGRVVDPAGRGLPAARLEVCCDETAFTRLSLAVRLASPVLQTIGGDDSGTFHAPALARGAGLRLRVSCAGFETREFPTLALTGYPVLVLRSSAEDPVLAGRVLRQDGTPALGSRVRLALAETRTNESGRFQLPLRGVDPDTALEVEDPHASTIRVPAIGQRLQDGGLSEVEVTLGEEHDRITGKLLGWSGAGGWQLLAYPSTGETGDGDALPAGTALCLADGSFELFLARGTYDLYACAADALRLVQRAGLDTRLGRWEIDVTAPPALASLHGTVRSDEGLALAHARLELRLELASRGDRRSFSWTGFTADELGRFAILADPALSLALSIQHPAAEQGVCAAVQATTAAHDLVVRRPALLQLAEAFGSDGTLAVLDAAGVRLELGGPTRMDTRFAFQAGRSAAFEVSTSARWLAIEQGGLERERIPIEPQSGELLQVRR